MDDFERYGDYTEYEDDIPKKRSNPVILMIKILIGVICIRVIGIFAFRLTLFSYYPDTVSNIYFTENLTAYYNETNGNIGAKTQELRSPYDDPDFANFFCDNLIVVDGAGELQVSLRYNNSAIENIKTELKLESLDETSANLFTFRLYDNYGRTYSFSYVTTDEFMMYHYYKLAFDGIPFASEGVDSPEWIRLEVFVEGQSSNDPFAMILVYENHQDFAKFDDYELSGEEHP